MYKMLDKITKDHTRSATNNLAMRKLRNATNHTASLWTLSMLCCVCTVLRSAALRSSEARRATIILSLLCDFLRLRCTMFCAAVRCTKVVMYCVVRAMLRCVRTALRCDAVCGGCVASCTAMCRSMRCCDVVCDRAVYDVLPTRAMQHRAKQQCNAMPCYDMRGDAVGRTTMHCNAMFCCALLYYAQIGSPAPEIARFGDG